MDSQPLRIKHLHLDGNTVAVYPYQFSRGGEGKNVISCLD